MVVSFCLSWLPSGGTVWAGVFLLAWWLLRDITGASIGKRMLGLRVVLQDGGESGPRERILRTAIAEFSEKGYSGARVLTTLLYALRARKLRYGVASLCIGGGMGIAMVVEAF